MMKAFIISSAMLLFIAISAKSQHIEVSYNADKRVVLVTVANDTDNALYFRNVGQERHEAPLYIDFMGEDGRVKYSKWLVLLLEGAKEPSRIYAIPPHTTYTFPTDVGYYIDFYADGNAEKKKTLGSMYVEVAIALFSLKNDEEVYSFLVKKNFDIY